MRGQQVVIESQKDVQELLAGLRDKVAEDSFWRSPWLPFSSKDFAGSVENDGAFDVQVIHRWQRGGGAYTPHLRGRIVSSGKGARIEGRLDYGEWDTTMRWFMVFPLLVFGIVVFAVGASPTVLVAIAVVGFVATIIYPPVSYSLSEDDETELCVLFERIAEAQREPMSVATG